MKAGYRKFYKYFSILVFMGCGYLMLNFWEEGKGQISCYQYESPKGKHIAGVEIGYSF